MDPTVSVSKGVFVFKNGVNKSKVQRKRVEKSLFDKCFTVEPWYESFKENWHAIEERVKILNHETYNGVLANIVEYIKSCYTNKEADVFENIIPSATLLTGVNQPDHLSQFTALMENIRDEVTPHIAIVHAQDAPTIRHLVENVVWQLMHDSEPDVSLDESMDYDSPTKKTNRTRKSNCTMMTLKRWYTAKYKAVTNKALSPTKKKKAAERLKSMVVILPDFESFNCEVLQDFVSIVSSYTSSLPIILVFGVATSVSALHKSFPYHVSSKLLIRVFQSHSSPVYLNEVLEEVFLTYDCPFHLSGRAFELFTDVFLFYDFSVTGFTQGVKYCMMDHYYGDNLKSLCCDRQKAPKAIARLQSEELEMIRRLPSFRPYVEAQDCRTRIDLLEDDRFLKNHLKECINGFHNYLFNFHTALKVLFVFVKDLPKTVLGQHLRELYVRCTTGPITESEEFKECMQYLSFQSKTKLIENINNALKIINTALQCSTPTKLLTPHKSSPSKNGKVVLDNTDPQNTMKTVRVHLNIFLKQIDAAKLETTVCTSGIRQDDAENVPENVPVLNRLKLKEQLLKATKVEKLQSEYEMVRSRLMNYLEEMFLKTLQPPHLQAFHEIFVFDDISSVKKQIIGSPRGAIHTALNNPVAYLQCTCCVLPSNDSVLQSLPDVSIAYKLHRECGRLINLYDWLQAFAAVLEPREDDEETRQVSPHIQLRFTRAVAEMQFLGFVKASKRKTDHVMRLTW